MLTIVTYCFYLFLNYLFDKNLYAQNAQCFVFFHSISVKQLFFPRLFSICVCINWPGLVVFIWLPLLFARHQQLFSSRSLCVCVCLVCEFPQLYIFNHAFVVGLFIFVSLFVLRFFGRCYGFSKVLTLCGVWTCTSEIDQPAMATAPAIIAKVRQQ